MARLDLCLLGAFRATLDGNPLLDFRSNKARALLAYLAVEANRPHPRSWLATLLWSEYDDRAARRSLSAALVNLRQILTPLAVSGDEIPILLADRQNIQFNLDASYVSTDVARFDALLEATRTHAHRNLMHCQTCVERLAQAATLYQGDFLAGLTLRDSAPFDEWRLVEEGRRHRQIMNVLAILTGHHLTRKDLGRAEHYARRQIALLPWHEGAHRQMMMILATQGERNAALAQYEICRRILSAELGIEPDAETVALWRSIQADKFSLPASLRPFDLENPYKGLRAFQETDAIDFFGREEFTHQLVEAVRRQGLVAVLGPSGSGKSSVIHAGLVSQLRAPKTVEADETWLVTTMRPGSQPFHSLAAALVPMAISSLGEEGQTHEERIVSTAQALAEAQIGLPDFVQPMADPDASVATSDNGAASPPGRRLLLIIDSFEELYTLCQDDKTRHAFLDTLLGGLTPQQTTTSLTILLALRADFMGAALAYRPLADALQDATYVLGPMNEQELERAIVLPAQGQGVVFQEGLVARILDDVGTASGRLPLLQFALTQLWERQRESQLTHAAYESIGRVEGALANYAEQVYSALSPEEQENARRTLLQMVRLSQAAEDTRRPITRSEVGEEGWRLVQKLADARLVVTDRDAAGREKAEIVHEALIQSWERLRGWIQADRVFQTWLQRTRVVVEQWEASRRDPDALLRGAPLAQAEEWLATRREDIDPRTRQFIAASQAQRDAELAMAETRRRRELEQAQALAESEHRRAESEAEAGQRNRRLAIALAVLFIVAVGTALIAMVQAREAARLAQVGAQARATADAEREIAVAARATAEAERGIAENQARRALARQLAAQAIALQDDQLDVALLLSLEANRLIEDSAARRDLLLHLDISPYLVALLHGYEDSVHCLAVSPDGRILASGDAGGTVLLWDLETRSTWGRPLKGHVGEVDSIAFSPDGSILASGGVDGAIVLWDVRTQKPLGKPLTGHTDIPTALRFTENGRVLVSAGADGTVRRWQVATGQPVGEAMPLAGEEGMALSSDASLVAAKDGVTITIQSVATGRLLTEPFAGHSAAIQHMTFSPDDTLLASSSFDHTTILWDVATGQRRFAPLTAHDGRRVLVSAFSPDGRILASGGTDNAVVLWDATTGQQLGPPLQGHSYWIRALVFSPDGQTLISGADDGTIILWDMGAHRQLSGHTAQVRGIAFTPPAAGSSQPGLASGSFDMTVRLWDLERGELAQPPLAGHSNAVVNVAASPDGKLLASGSAGGDIILWDSATGQQLGPALLGHSGPVVGLAFSPDGRLLASGSFDQTIILWDVETGQPVGASLNGHVGWVLSLAFSPDGQLLASGSADKTVRLWDVATGEAVAEPLVGHTNWVDSVAFSPDGRLLASGSSDQTIRLWEVPTGLPAGKPLTGHAAPVWFVSFVTIDDGYGLVSGSGDGAVIQWDLDTLEPIGPALRASVEIESMALSPDHSTVALGAFDGSGTVSLWRLDNTPWPIRACRIANRNLTKAEWQQYLGDVTYRESCTEAHDLIR